MRPETWSAETLTALAMREKIRRKIVAGMGYATVSDLEEVETDEADRGGRSRREAGAGIRRGRSGRRTQVVRSSPRSPGR